MTLPDNIEYEIHLNNHQYIYFVIQSPANTMISDEQMRTIVAAKMPLSTLGTFSSITSASTASCPASSAGSLTSAASLSTADIGREQADDNTIREMLARYQKYDKKA